MAVEYWTYAGRRIGGSRKLMHCWITGEGEQLQFSKLSAGGVIGGTYEVEVKRDGGTISASMGRWTGRKADAATVAQWTAGQAEDVVEIEAKNAERRARKEADELGDLTLRQLRGLTRGRLPHQRAGLLAVLIGYVNG